MQEVLFDMAVLGLFVFLFAAISIGRRDDRLWCWMAGWFLVAAHFAAELPQPSSVVWRNIATCIDLDSLALAAVAFVISTMILQEGRTAGLRLGALLFVPTIFSVPVIVFILGRGGRHCRIKEKDDDEDRQGPPGTDEEPDRPPQFDVDDAGNHRGDSSGSQ